MKSLIEISAATSMSSTDIDYLAKQFIEPDEGGGRRGVKKRWGNLKVVEFAIAKRLLNYGITVFRIREIFETLRANRKWQALFEADSLSTSARAHMEAGRYYLHLKADDSLRVNVYVSKQNILAKLWKAEKADALIIDITDALGLAAKESKQ